MLQIKLLNHSHFDLIPELIRFINLPENIKFKKSIQNKLFQFRDRDDLREANVWWRNIFKQRMPISKSS